MFVSCNFNSDSAYKFLTRGDSYPSIKEPILCRVVENRFPITSSVWLLRVGSASSGLTSTYKREMTTVTLKERQLRSQSEQNGKIFRKLSVRDQFGSF